MGFSSSPSSESLSSSSSLVTTVPHAEKPDECRMFQIQNSIANGFLVSLLISKCFFYNVDSIVFFSLKKKKQNIIFPDVVSVPTTYYINHLHVFYRDKTINVNNNGPNSH